MELFYKKYGEGAEVIVILHGIFGSLDNWHTVAQNLSEQYTVYTLDMRNHGHSPHSNEMSVALMAEDVHVFFSRHQLKNVVLIGHSMGGKIAMKCTELYPENIQKLVVVDIAPKAYKAGHTPYFDAYKNIDLEQISSRKELDAEFAKYEPNDGVRMFLMKNIVSNGDGGYTLKINIDGIKNGYEDVIGALQLTTINTPTLFISGEKSGYIKATDHSAIKTVFKSVTFKSVANAGHWVHAENRVGFLVMLTQFLK